MDIPVVIHKDAGTVYGVLVPDIPGCASYGDTINEALRNAKDAITQHIETMLEEGMDIDIRASNIDDLKDQDDYAGGTWALVNVDMAKLDARPERINISIPRFVLNKIDCFAESRHESRSGFLSRAALRLIEAESA